MDTYGRIGKNDAENMEPNDDHGHLWTRGSTLQNRRLQVQASPASADTWDWLGASVDASTVSFPAQQASQVVSRVLEIGDRFTWVSMARAQRMILMSVSICLSRFAPISEVKHESVAPDANDGQVDGSANIQWQTSEHVETAQTTNSWAFTRNRKHQRTHPYEFLNPRSEVRILSAPPMTNREFM